jgi:hypothetical protein
LPFLNSRTLAEYFRVTQGESQEAMLDEIRVWRTAPAGLEGLTYASDWRDGITWGDKDNAWNVDVNNNSLNNFGDYSFNFHPINPATGPTQPVWVMDREAGKIEITYRRNKDAADVDFIIEKSTQLGGAWERVHFTKDQVDVDPIDGHTERVKFSIPTNMADTQCFYRLRAASRQ